MKQLLWYGYNEEASIEILLSVKSAEWLLDLIPRDDKAHEDVRRVINECSNSNEQHK